MAREYHRTRLSIWDLDAYRGLTPGAQHLHYVLSSGSMSYCGLVDWRPARIRPKARGWTEEQMRMAAAELETAGVVLFDDETEEALVWHHIGEDELLRNPKLAVAVASAYGAVASQRLRAAVVSEIRHVRKTEPDYSSWSHQISKKHLDRLMSLPCLDQFEIANQIGNPNTNDIPNGIGNAGTVANTNAERSESPIPAQVRNANGITNPDRSKTYLQPATYNQQPTGSHVTGVPHQGDRPATSSDPPPPTHHREHPNTWVAGCEQCDAVTRTRIEWLNEQIAADRPGDRCPAHLTDAQPPPCGRCAEARRTAQQWDRDHEKRLAADANARRALVHICQLCDESGWRKPPPELRDVDPPVKKCNHLPGDLPAEWRALVAELLATPTQEQAHA